MWPFTKKVCGTCKHWQYPDGKWQNIPTELFNEDIDVEEYYYMSKEERDASQSHVKMCLSPRLQFYTRPAEGEAAVIDGSRFRGSLCTTATFGCTNWEKR